MKLRNYLALEIYGTLEAPQYEQQQKGILGDNGIVYFLFAHHGRLRLREWLLVGKLPSSIL